MLVDRAHWRLLIQGGSSTVPGGEVDKARQTVKLIDKSNAWPLDVELEAVPPKGGPSLARYRYVYSGERVMLVDPETRTVV